MKKTLITLLVCAISASSFSQTPYEWAQSYECSQVGAAIHDQALDSYNNVISVGEYWGQIDLDPGAGTAMHYNSTGPAEYLQKIDANGNYLWSVQWSNNLQFLSSVAVDKATGSIYVFGQMTGRLDMDPGPNTVYGGMQNGGDGIVIIKLNSFGDFIWGEHFYSSQVSINSFEIDHSGDIIMAGYFSETLRLSSTSPNQDLISNGSLDGFMYKIKADGTPIWAKSFGGSGYDILGRLVVDQNNNYWLSGRFFGNMMIDSTQSNSSISTNGFFDGVIIKFDSDGKYLSSAVFGGPGEDGISDIAIDSNGNLYVSGYYGLDADADLGSGTHMLTPNPNGFSNAVLMKMDQNFDLEKVLVFEGDNSTTGGRVIVTPNNKIITSGDFRGTTEFNPAMPSRTRSSRGLNANYVSSFTDDLMLDWNISFSTVDNVYSGKLNQDNNGNVYIGGRYKESFFLNEDINSLFTSQSPMYSDIFIIKLNPTALASLKDHENQFEFAMFPNPTENMFALQFEKAFSGGLTIYNQLGMPVYNSTLKNVMQYNSQLELNAGTYFVSLEGADQLKSVQKLVIR